MKTKNWQIGKNEIANWKKIDKNEIANFLKNYMKNR